MTDAEQARRYTDLLRLLREFAQRCAWAAMVRDAEADVAEPGRAGRLRSEAEAAWQAAGQARAAAEAAAHQFTLHGELPPDVAAVYGAVLDLPATDTELANVLAHVETMVTLARGKTSPETAGVADPLPAVHAGATPEEVAALTWAMMALRDNPSNPEVLAALYIEAIAALRQGRQTAAVNRDEQHEQKLRLAALAVAMAVARAQRFRTLPPARPAVARQPMGLHPIEEAQRESLGQHRTPLDGHEGQEQ
ncbi:hypothetical protein [Streptomyces sp. NPDC001933]|uniref:hypothetical protein n=1 Tax=Streptomyces sp. NPDC001933 TaxID=3364626 RepID=UPI003685E431